MRQTDTNRTYLKTDRVCQELRRGGMVMLRIGTGAACLLRAAELAGPEDRAELQRLGGSGALLVLTHTRMESLGRALPTEFCSASLPVHNLDHDQIGRLAAEQPSADLLDASISLMGERRGSLADYATRLLRIAKLLPAVLMARVSSRDSGQMQRLCDDNNIMLIEGRDIDSHIEAEAQSLRIAARASVPLRLAEDAEVVMFRAELGRDEHFAVIVGNRRHAACQTSLTMHHRRYSWQPEMRLWRSASGSPGDDVRGWRGYPALSCAGRAEYRPSQQDAGLCASG